MLSTAWFWIRVLSFVLGIGALWVGLYLMKDDDQSGLRLVSGGAGIVLLDLAATFWPL